MLLTLNRKHLPTERSNCHFWLANKRLVQAAYLTAGACLAADTGAAPAEIILGLLSAAAGSG